MTRKEVTRTALGSTAGGGVGLALAHGVTFGFRKLINSTHDAQVINYHKTMDLPIPSQEKLEQMKQVQFDELKKSKKILVPVFTALGAAYGGGMSYLLGLKEPELTTPDLDDLFDIFNTAAHAKRQPEPTSEDDFKRRYGFDRGNIEEVDENDNVIGYNDDNNK